MIEQGNDVLLTMNDVILSKKREINLLEADYVVAQRQLDDYYVHHPEIAPTQSALAGI